MDNGYVVHGTGDERLERILEEAMATVEAERPRRTVPRRPHLPRRTGTWLMRSDRESGK